MTVHRKLRAKTRFLCRACPLMSQKMRLPVSSAPPLVCIACLNSRCSTCSSEQVGLLHDAQKFLFVHLSITISVSLINHLLQFLVGHSLTQFLGNSFQIFE